MKKSPVFLNQTENEKRTLSAGKGSKRKIRRVVLLTILPLVWLMCSPACPGGWASEVIPESDTEVLVREHPQTGFPYVSIVDPRSPQNFLSGKKKKYSRPKRSMLEAGVKSNQMDYDGPVSDRKKVYLLAGGLAAGGLAGYALMPAAAAGGGAAAGAGTYAAASAAVTAGTFSTHWVMKYDDRPDDFTQVSASREIPLTA